MKIPEGFTPAAWMYECKNAGDVWVSTEQERILEDSWTETPLYASPPTDQAAIIRDLEQRLITAISDKTAARQIAKRALKEARLADRAAALAEALERIDGLIDDEGGNPRYAVFVGKELDALVPDIRKALANYRESVK